MRAYQHGGDVIEFARSIGVTPDEIIDLSSNINFIKPAIQVDFNGLDIHGYPSYQGLYSSLSQHYGIDEFCMEVFNGGSSAIFSFFKHSESKICTLYSPCYLEYKRAALLCGYKVEHVNRFLDMDQDITEESVVVFVNPSTPDGKFYDLPLLLEYWKEKRATILIDESFLDFTHYRSCLNYIKEYDKLYILKSMTKFYGSAGIRIGVLLSQSQNIQALRYHEPLWKISEFDCAYIQDALRDNQFRRLALSLNAKNSILLEKILIQSSLFAEVVNSEVNFILARLKNLKASELQEKLSVYNILIRDCSNFDFLDESYVRFAVKSEKSILKLKEALGSIER